MKDNRIIVGMLDAGNILDLPAIGRIEVDESLHRVSYIFSGQHAPMMKTDAFSQIKRPGGHLPVAFPRVGELRPKALGSRIKNDERMANLLDEVALGRYRDECRINGRKARSRGMRKTSWRLASPSSATKPN